MRTLTAMFDDRADAETARTRLAAAGISADDVTIHDQSSLGADHGRTGDRASDRPVTGHDDPGIWSSIKNFFSGDDAVYEEGLRRGGYLLTARVDEAMADDAIDILDDEGTIDLDARADSWRTEGWTGGSTAGADRAYDDRTPNTDTSDRVIPIVEEQLSVGKREVERGGVRVRSYITETPVHEDVTLRQTRVDVERRPVTGDTAVRPEDVDGMFRDETIEMRETAEEAVVTKTAVVREELAIKRTVDERIERIDDNVRRTEVEVDDLGDRDRR